jgi:hypothetical protein
MIRCNAVICRSARINDAGFARVSAIGLLAAALLTLAAPAGAQSKSKAPPPKPAAPAAKPAVKPATSAGHTGSTTTHTTAGGGAPRTATPSVKAPPGGSVHTTKSGGEVAKNSAGQVTAYKGPNGHVANFDSHGGVREVHANGTCGGLWTWARLYRAPL